LARHAALPGASGSGNSHLARLIMSPFIFIVDVDEDIYAEEIRETSRYMEMEIAESEAGDNGGIASWTSRRLKLTA
jgi:adenylate kinase family enzyme